MSGLLHRRRESRKYDAHRLRHHLRLRNDAHKCASLRRRKESRECGNFLFLCRHSAENRPYAAHTAYLRQYSVRQVCPAQIWGSRYPEVRRPPEQRETNLRRCPVSLSWIKQGGRVMLRIILLQWLRQRCHGF